LPADTEKSPFFLSRAHDMSGFVAHKLSGLIWSRMEVTDEADRGATGDSEAAIRGGILWVEESDHPPPFLLLKKSGHPEEQKSGQLYLLLTTILFALDTSLFFLTIIRFC